ncbi:glycogen debranching N-terminal domain-containing protein [Solwaraspora sp. WMMD406]|uniref:glycogen debranching N-terminal domain-containing protein n=1 Tax=Solwaraspora sp. WMMD406 TaxID=3016095 RepID=UPI0024166B5A|nr:glycogen debranching N-terminal domain-containing protein [Solwaraspora sp. WMMD406]MDG4766045.1 glycogen debranching N-terminal domain-containing protein [Solwaraspora sp. WMMD406]
MTDAIGRFFDSLAVSGADRVPPTTRGTLRFDLRRDGRTRSWSLTYQDGAVAVDRRPGEADCTVDAPEEIFERLLDGRDNVVPLLLRNGVSVRGELQLLLAFRRLLPVPADSAGPASRARPLDAAPRPSTATSRPVSILYGNLFMVTDRRGDVEATPFAPFGLFFYDTRFLSRWRLTVDDQRLHTLSIDDLQYFETRFFQVPGEPTHYVDADVSVFRHRWIGDAFTEQITVFNHREKPVRLRLRLEVAADFAEVLEAKDGWHTDRDIATTVEPEALRFRYERDTYFRETIVSSSVPAALDPDGMSFDVELAGQQSWCTDVTVKTFVRGAGNRDLRESLRSYAERPKPQVHAELDQWVARAPKLTCDYKPLWEAYRQSVVDLGALRYKGVNFRELLPAAGMPWFMTYFGRDSLISCLQAVPFVAGTTVPALRIMALAQGTREDPFRAEQPGKIPQESRYGESALFNEVPLAADFSAADTTALFVVLLDEYERWTGDNALVRAMEFETRAALRWIDEHADLMGDGYLWYGPRDSRAGVLNQSWKCSPGAITFHDGEVATFPQAVCEIQGYVYDAKLRGARLARRCWDDPDFADQLERQAAELRARFNRDFWLPDRGYFAHALQADGRRVDALTSNIGHLLWSGIVDPDKARAVVHHLMGPALFSGWGIRTLADTERRFNPVGYHTGTVWPFDNSLIAWGLRRYGYREEAARVARAVLEASQYFGARLPESFAGYDRSLTKYPVPYAAAGSPHATSAGAPLLLLRVLLGLEPYEGELIVDPAVPEDMGHIELHDIPGPWGLLDALGRGRRELSRPRRRRRRPGDPLRAAL